MTTPPQPSPGISERLTERFGGTGVRSFGSGPDSGPRLADLVLPGRLLPYFHTGPEEPVALAEYAHFIGRTVAPEQRSWARLGSDRAFDLCVGTDGAVLGLLIGYREPLRFVSTTAAAFAAGLLELDLLLEVVTRTDDPAEAAQAFRGTSERLHTADPAAFADPGNWWPLVLEDIRTTAGERSYAAFEYTTATGESQILSQAGSVCVHAEQRTWAALRAAGVQPQQVTRIHTELQACFLPGHYCSLWLKQQFPDARLTHNFPYGDDARQRADSLRRLREAAAQAEQGR
ncbi:hypothetical protein GXW82_09645 [Streptacidiphilus sp. 4-A2]|nr:hypothetical protein [Streptacidiphilus sp. 4-A2]